MQICWPILQHWPWVHCSAIGSHVVPHMPQLLMSVCVSTHEVSHATFGIAQTTLHAPATHDHIPPPMIAPASWPQMFPHLPQFVLSVYGSTHVFPQRV
jgi:hypothetical protein